MINRINLILQAKNITAKQFAEEIGIQPSGMSHILGGRNNPSLEFVAKVLRRYPELDANWLLLGRGSMYAAQNLGMDSDSLGQEDVHSVAPSGYEMPQSSMQAPEIPDEELFPALDAHQAMSAPESEHRLVKLLLIYDDGTFCECHPLG